MCIKGHSTVPKDDPINTILVYIMENKISVTQDISPVCWRVELRFYRIRTWIAGDWPHFSSTRTPENRIICVVITLIPFIFWPKIKYKCKLNTTCYSGVDSQSVVQYNNFLRTSVRVSSFTQNNSTCFAICPIRTLRLFFVTKTEWNLISDIPYSLN